MLYFITILFIAFTLISFIGVFSENDTNNRKYMAICFAISTFGLIISKVIGGML